MKSLNKQSIPNRKLVKFVDIEKKIVLSELFGSSLAMDSGKEQK